MRNIGRRLREAKGPAAFLFEVAVVVVGVLIALGAQQLVDNWTWERRLERTEEALRIEQQGVFFYLAEETITAPCVLAQIELVRQHLLQDGPFEPLDAVSQAGVTQVIRMPYRPMAEDAWIAASADGTVQHMDYERRQATAGTYTLLRAYLDQQDRSLAAISRLAVLAEPVEIDALTRVRLLQELAEQESRTQMQDLIAGQLMAAIRSTDRMPDEADIDIIYEIPESTVAYCRQQGLPTGEWRERLAPIPAEDEA